MKYPLNKKEIIHNMKMTSKLFESIKHKRNNKKLNEDVYNDILDSEINKDEIIKDIKEYIKSKKFENKSVIENKKRKPKNKHLKEKTVFLKESQLNNLLKKFEEEFYSDIEDDEDYEDYEKER